MHINKTRYVLAIITWFQYLMCFSCQTTGNYDTTQPTEIYYTSESIQMNDSISTSGTFNATAGDELTGSGNPEAKSSDDYHEGITLASWRWNEIGVFYTVSLFIIITGLSKVAFHHAEWLSSHVPESCLLIIIGVIVGSIIFAIRSVKGATENSNSDEDYLPKFTPRLFFLVLLPPVIQESAYSLYNATFCENITSIFVYAVVGTIFNTFAIGLLLFGLNEIGWIGEWYKGGSTSIALNFTLAEFLVFSALLSAVDPVAVLAIFQEVGVNKDLYFLVFGESLFNDAITVVLYNTMVALARKNSIAGTDYSMAVMSFFTVNCGGMVIGIFFGLLTAFITKTTSEVRVVEPLAVIGMAYLSYLTAELFHFSGIISIIFCGLLQAHYTFQNISEKSYVTVKYFTKMLSATSEAIIFLFLGTVLLSYDHEWNTGFVMWSLILCLVCRFVGVYILTAILNTFRVKKIGSQEQFIMAYGGLRGAVGFSLVMMLKDDETKAKNVYLTTMLVVILFTVFIQGATIKPLVKLLNIEISGKNHKSLLGEIHDQVTSHLMAGIEEIIGFRGNYYIKRKIMDFDEKYLQKIFLRDQSGNRIRRAFEKTAITYHYAHLYGPITLVEDSKTNILRDDTISKGPRLSHIPFVSEVKSVQSRNAAKQISLLFPEVEMRNSGPIAKRKILKKAFQSNPFQKYFQRYNPNLIDDDRQEIDAQLALRQNRGYRITLAACEQQYSSQPPGQLSREVSRTSQENLFPAMKSVPPDSIQQLSQEEMAGIEYIMQRAQRRKTISNMGTYANNFKTIDEETMGEKSTPRVQRSLSSTGAYSYSEKQNDKGRDVNQDQSSDTLLEMQTSSTVNTTPLQGKTPEGKEEQMKGENEESQHLMSSEENDDFQDETPV